MSSGMNSATGGRWYLFLHQVPPTPGYFRARVLRQLNQLGAVAIKKSAYVLPANDETFEDLQWLRKGIVNDGGEAWIFRAGAIAGHTDEDLREAFLKQRAVDYVALASDARALLEELRRETNANREEAGSDEQSTAARARKLQRRLDAIRQIDYFGAPERQEVVALMNEIERSQNAPLHTEAADTKSAEFHGRRWVTRAGIKVDRMASAWLIRRFIDPSPEFIFVDPATYKHAPRELRFDMFEGEFTHEGNKCTFEVLVERFHLDDPGFDALAEIVHDIDLKEAAYRRNETAGVATMIEGIARRHAEDRARLEAGTNLFDSLYESLRQ